MELIVLVLEIILMVIKLKVTPEEATRRTSEKYGIAFARLWSAIPRKWR